MKIIKSFLIINLFLLYSCSNNNENFDLRKNTNFDSIAVKRIHSLSDNNLQPTLNYVDMLLVSWKLLETKSYNKPDSLCVSCNTSNSDFSGFSQILSFVGDNKNVISLANESNGQSIGMSLNEKIKLQNAKKYILERYANERIIMFNEAHDRAQTRSFLLSILPDLKKAGATCLAMETFNHLGNLKQLDNTTGYYTCEPLMGQIVREALKLDLKLVAYEDQDGNSGNERDSIQAKNLFEKIAGETTIEKTIVLAGYGHISETSWPDSPLKFMAMYFKQMTKIDPLTVNQVDFIEESNFGSFAGDSIKAFDKSDFKNLGEGSIFADPSYDIYVCHPVTKYIHNRPDWLLTSPDKKFTDIGIPANLKPVLIQAYLTKEIRSEEDYKIKIPYDQTFESEYGKAWLALNTKEKYNIVFRDQYNNIIHRIVK